MGRGGVLPCDFRATLSKGTLCGGAMGRRGVGPCDFRATLGKGTLCGGAVRERQRKEREREKRQTERELVAFDAAQSSSNGQFEF